jgi:mRNA-degrading endonuclease RelE of RelBE toxin-antitoxin system
MSYEIIATPRFVRDIKKLVKKYPSIKNEYAELTESLIQHPKQGTPLGHHCYKIRMAIFSKGQGKSGGARVITCVKVTDSTVYLLSMYDKSQKENTSDKELLKLIMQIIPVY